MFGVFVCWCISTSSSNILQCVQVWPINPIVCRDLNRNLILEQVSRLDAFGGYPFRT